MTSLIVSQSLADHLLAGNLAITQPLHVLPAQRHLLPVAQLPTCTTCGGSGKKFVLEGSPSVALNGPCDDCKDGVPRVLTLTVDVPGFHCNCNCHQTDAKGRSFMVSHVGACCNSTPATQRPVARVQVEKALPIRDAFDESEAGDCVDVMTHIGMRLWCAGWDENGIDISHLLLPGIDWSGYALLVTNVEPIHPPS